MTKTTNYQLNQWAKSDRVMMDDFNADNAKIDAALKANADAIAAETTARIAGDALVKLKEITVTSETTQLSIDMSDIDLNLYEKIILYPHLPGNDITDFRFHLNDAAKTQMASCTPCHRACPQIEVFHGEGFYYSHSTELTTTAINHSIGYVADSAFGPAGPDAVVFYKPSGKFSAGGTVRIYGLKK